MSLCGPSVSDSKDYRFGLPCLTFYVDLNSSPPAYAGSTWTISQALVLSFTLIFSFCVDEWLHVCEVRVTTCVSWFIPYFYRVVPRIKLRLSGLATSGFICWAFLLFPIYFFKFLVILVMCMGMCIWVQVPVEFRGECQIPWSWRFTWLGAAQCVC